MFLKFEEFDSRVSAMIRDVCASSYGDAFPGDAAVTLYNPNGCKTFYFQGGRYDLAVQHIEYELANFAPGTERLFIDKDTVSMVRSTAQSPNYSAIAVRGTGSQFAPLRAATLLSFFASIVDVGTMYPGELAQITKEVEEADLMNQRFVTPLMTLTQLFQKYQK